MAKKSSSKGFESAPLSAAEPVYGEHNAYLLVTEIPVDQSRGYMPRDWRANPHGAAWRGSKPFPTELIIPRSEWDERIEEQERTKTRLSDLILASGLPCKDQNGTNYCWINAPTHVAEINLIQQNQRMPDGSLPSLSPASNGCKIKNFRNNGGWGQEGLDRAVEFGFVPSKLWPDNAISKQYDTAEAWAEALKYKPTNYYDLRPRVFDEQASCYLHRMATADGHNWWSHEVTGVDLVIVSNSVRDASRQAIEALWKQMNAKGYTGPRMGKDERDQRLELAASKYGTRKRNSWGMSYGDRGFFILAESKANADDACCSVDLMPA